MKIKKNKVISIIIMMFVVVISLIGLAFASTILTQAPIGSTQTTGVPTLASTVNNTNVINITNYVYINTTNYVTTYVNTTNNLTNFVNNTNLIFVNNTIYNNFTNNITNSVNYTNVVTFFSYQNFTVENNITVNVNVTSDILNNITNIILNTISNNITILNDIINNVTNTVNTNVLYNVTNEITNNNNITNAIIINVTDIIYNTLYNNITNDIVNNVSNTIYSYFYANFTNEIFFNLTEFITNNIANNNNITNIISINVTNNLVNNINITNSIINNVSTTVLNSIYSNVTVNNSVNISFNSYYDVTDVYNITNNISNTLNIIGNNNNLGEIFNNTIINSPIQHVISDEDNLLMYNHNNHSTFYIDDTNNMVGVNILNGSESHAQAFVVSTEINVMNGTITSISYDAIFNVTTINVNTVLPEYFVDAGNIYINGTKYYVFNRLNDTSFSINGNRSINTSSWSYQQAPYIDVNGAPNTERGYTISSDGVWQWAWYVPDWSNNTVWCLQNRNAWFNNNTNAFCIDSNGNMNIYGKLLANSYYGELYNVSQQSFTMTTQNVWYNITSFDIGSNSGFESINNYKLNCTQNGLYFVTYSINAEVNNNDNINYRIIINNTVEQKGDTIQRYANGLPNNIVGQFLHRFTEGEIVYLQLQDITRNGATITFYNKNLIMTRVGN